MTTTLWLEDHARELTGALEGLCTDAGTVSRWARLLAERLVAGGRLLVAGNGGSAAEAQHLTGELVGRFLTERRPYSAICLSAETSALTAIVNDYGPDEAFARQVEAHGRRDDVLILLSTSGASANVLAAADRGRELGLHVWAMTGPGPNPLQASSHDTLCVAASSTAAIQEMHLVVVHALCAAVDAELGELDGLVSRRPRPAAAAASAVPAQVNGPAQVSGPAQVNGRTAT